MAEAEFAVPYCGPHLADTTHHPVAIAEVHIVVGVTFEIAIGSVTHGKRAASHGGEGRAKLPLSDKDAARDILDLDRLRKHFHRSLRVMA